MIDTATNELVPLSVLTRNESRFALLYETEGKRFKFFLDLTVAADRDRLFKTLRWAATSGVEARFVPFTKIMNEKRD